MVSETISVSYLVLGAFGLFVIGSSVLVGVLPPLVNRPQCKDDDALLYKTSDEVKLNKSLSVGFAKSFDLQEIRSKLLNLKNMKEQNANKFSDKRVKRGAEEQKPKLSSTSSQTFKPTPPLSLNERIESFKQRSPLQSKAIETRRRISIRNPYPICKEILEPSPSVYYPWYNVKLPGNVVPVNYNISFFVPVWGIDEFDGESQITVNVKEATNFFLLHVKGQSNIPLLESVTTADGVDIPVECVGEFFANDYYIFKTQNVVQPSEIMIKFSFIGFLSKYESGVFEISFGNEPDVSTLLATKFEPLDARQAYPCFDEPAYKATYDFAIDHPIGTKALFNTDPIEEFLDPDRYLTTRFAQTPPMPTYLIGLVAFNLDDFESIETATSNNETRITLWARKAYIQEGFGNDTLEFALRTYEALADIMTGVDPISFPSKIDLFAIPDYPVNEVPHFGLPIFKDNRILLKNSTASERDRQKISLLLAKSFAEFWFGSFTTFKWWDELWLQEAFSDFISYKVVGEAFPDYSIEQQFITEELIYALVEDNFPSSHPIYKPVSSPYEIEEYFDVIESSKAAAILRMVEEELEGGKMVNAIKSYLNAHPWGVGEIDVFYQSIGTIDKWNAKEFFLRWLTQSNYPLLTIRLQTGPGNVQQIKIDQSRSLNTNESIFGNVVLYPTEYNFTWYVPVTCSFGTGPSNTDQTREQDFYLDTKSATFNIINPDNLAFTWVHCDRKFAGYYVTDYSVENWENLGAALRAKNNEFLPEDRANIIHNLWVNAYTERLSYYVVEDVLSYITLETEYLPWETLAKHLYDLLKILDHKASFLQISNFFVAEMKKIEADIDPWTPGQFHIDGLLKETILDLSCRLLDPYCLDRVAELWEIVKPSLLSLDFDNSILPPYVREVVFSYHVQNSYDVDDYAFIIRDYETVNDLQLQRKLLQALTFSRQPWLLATFIDLQDKDGLNNVDLFDAIKYLSNNPLGRELIWDYFRINYEDLLKQFGLEDPRLGQAIVDISSSFEDGFLYVELLEFIYFSVELTGATAYARFRALEIVSTNVLWINDKEDELVDAFKGGRKFLNESNSTLARTELSFKKLKDDFLPKMKKLNSEFLEYIKKQQIKAKFFKY